MCLRTEVMFAVAYVVPWITTRVFDTYTPPSLRNERSSATAPSPFESDRHGARYFVARPGDDRDSRGIPVTARNLPNEIPPTRVLSHMKNSWTGGAMAPQGVQRGELAGACHRG